MTTRVERTSDSYAPVTFNFFGPPMNPVNALLARSLRGRFDRWLDSPRAYADQLSQQGAVYPFPESDIMPCVFPLLAYASRVRRGQPIDPDDLRRMSVLVELARDAAIRRVRPPGGELERLSDYRRHSVYLGLLNLALTAFRWSTGDQRFARLQEHLCSLLQAALQTSNGEPLWSYPEVSWPFDTVAPVLSLWLDDLSSRRSRHQNVVQAHLAWLVGAGSDPACGLPWSAVPMGENSVPPVPPRGCAVALMLAWLWPVAPDVVEKLYPRFVAGFWRRVGPLAGFREWPEGVTGWEDCDSGPLVRGLGLAATGFGLAAAQVNGNRWRGAVLSAQGAMAIGAIQTLPLLPFSYRANRWQQKLGIQLHQKYLTGFLLGDASLFMALTLRHLWQHGT